MNVIFLGDLTYPEKDCVRLDFDNALFDDRLVIANLEGGIGVSDLPVKMPTNFQLYSHPEIFKIGRQFNIGAVTLANNHSDDFVGGLARTTALLDDQVIPYAGTSARPYLTLERHGRQIVILPACAPITGIKRSRRSQIRCFYPNDLLVQIRAIKAADPTNILVIFPHWGYELSLYPEPADRDWARAAIDAGADAVIGHHPHVVQGAEQYGDGFIFYSIGNWILPEAKYLDKNVRYRSDDFALQLAVELMWGDKMLVALHWFRYDRGSGVISYEGTDAGLDGSRIGALSGFAGLLANEYRSYFRGQIAAGKATPKGYPTFGGYSGLLGMSYPFKLGYIRLRKWVRKILIELGLYRPAW